MTEKTWKLNEGVNLDADVAEEVAKIACALKSLALYTALVCDHENDPEELQEVVDEGVKAMEKLFES
jgi:hypothetical protein